MRTTLKFLPLAIIIMVSGIAFSQDSISVDKVDIAKETKANRIRPFRIGAKLGFPNLVGGNIEYVTPLLRNKIAANADYSSINGSWFSSGDTASDTDLKFSYFEGGINYYIFKPGKGVYTGINYGNLKFKGSEQDVPSDIDENKSGKGFYDFSHSAVNLKLGAKLGGLIYFRSEVGYSLKKFPTSIDRRVDFNDGSSEMQKIEFDSEESPVNISSLISGLIFNIGMGFSF
ncbi:hypothetical protein [Gillisia sp. CAL575]|uniref:hypothetical protein n=1 Tax=Gillisia sp. CAL575 TaxID=985255 RepID=UPI000558D6BF|nr:hypothetical protein [Gillisia sp. CAL575]